MTAEVTPHHWSSPTTTCVTYDTNFKVNPPLRSGRGSRRAPAGVADGTIDAIATDHAPHAVEEKESEFDLSPPGTIGLETALAAVFTHLVEPGTLVFRAPSRRSPRAPRRRILGASATAVPSSPGRPANLVVFDPGRRWMVEPPFASKAGTRRSWGAELTGAVRQRCCTAHLTVADGKATR